MVWRRGHNDTSRGSHSYVDIVQPRSRTADDLQIVGQFDKFRGD